MAARYACCLYVWVYVYVLCRCTISLDGLLFFQQLHILQHLLSQQVANTDNISHHTTEYLTRFCDQLFAHSLITHKKLFVMVTTCLHLSSSTSCHCCRLFEYAIYIVKTRYVRVGMADEEIEASHEHKQKKEYLVERFFFFFLRLPILLKTFSRRFTTFSHIFAGRIMLPTHTHTL